MNTRAPYPFHEPRQPATDACDPYNTARAKVARLRAEVGADTVEWVDPEVESVTIQTRKPT